MVVLSQRDTCDSPKNSLYCVYLWEEVGESGAPEHSGVPQLIGGVEQMFMGEVQHSLDSKGRLTIPARYRDLLEGGAYITQGFDRNLMVWPVSALEHILQSLGAKSITDPDTRLLQRLIFSRGERLEVDGAGRILIPGFLRQFAELGSEVVVVGVGKYFEIWSPELWGPQLTQIQDADANAVRFKAFDISFG
jgi:transcriptional regulator MraZ